MNTVPAAATSYDGRTFTFDPGAWSGRPGELVRVDPDGSPLVGQVRESDPGRGIGSGLVLGMVVDDGTVRLGHSDPFVAAPMRCLTGPELASFQDQRGAQLVVGSWRSGDVEAPLALRAQGFNRHTFLCGQSGSGKTYALGVLLEQLIMHTELPIVVLDPNGDYVHLGTPRPDAPPAESAAIQAADIVVRHGRAADDAAIKVPFVRMPRHVQAAILELDPVRDREEYNEWLHLELTSAQGTMDDVTSALRSGTAAQRALGERLENLGLGEWDIWPWNLDREEPPHHRVTVLDVSTFRNPKEPLVAALDVVERLWAHREERIPTLVVIDEAHNLCPAAPSAPLQRVLTDRLIQIAAEGRKYGIWLLLSTQRPSKVHPQVTSQCDNLVLMRMNSPTDVDDLGRLFGFVPPAMLHVSPTFAQGELLVAGVFAPVPIEGRVGRRLTLEGGSDVRVPMPAGPTRQPGREGRQVSSER